MPNSSSAAAPSSSQPSFWKNVTSPVPFNANKFYELLTAPEFPEQDAKQWIEDRFPLTFQVSLAYVLVVFGTKFMMRDRPPFSLFVPLNAWNLFLAVFSTIGTLKLAPEFFSTLSNQGFQASYCHVYDYTEGTSGYWVWLFITSKMFELVDTVFLVLRKRPLMFLHWYHHILTMMYAFYSYPITPAFNRWGIFLNYFVHSYMYSYYFLRSMKIRVPGAVARFVTTIQIWQFIISVGILCHLGWITFAQNAQCDLDGRVFAFAVSMDVSYLILFINFFLHAYVFGGGKAKYKKTTTTEQQLQNGTAGDEQQQQQQKLKEHQNGTAMANGAVRRVG